jgi:2-keto-4-pentenoate hydratase/2-oxohepta-3-ene-1,7-dioic acid hydratase in catechol pathway
MATVFRYAHLTTLSFSLNSGTVICVGGPAFVQSIRPTDEELFKRYNPDLQKRSLEEGDRRAREFDEYVTRLKQWSKSDKSSASLTTPVDI